MVLLLGVTHRLHERSLSMSQASSIVGSMQRKVKSAEELLAMSPAEQQQDFEASVVTDIDEVPPELLERVRAKVAARSSEAGSPKSA